MKNPLQNMPKQKLQHLMVIGILTLIVVCGIFLFWISGRYDTWTSSREKIQKLIPQIDAAERSDLAETQNEAMRRQLTVLIETQRVTMVTGDVFSWGLREFTLFAEKYPIQLIGLRPGLRLPHPRETGFETYSVAMDLKGEYDDIGRFVADMENHFPTAYVRGLNFTAGDGTVGGRQATMEVAFLIWPESGNIWINPKTKEEPKKNR